MPTVALRLRSSLAGCARGCKLNLKRQDMQSEQSVGAYRVHYVFCAHRNSRVRRTFRVTPYSAAHCTLVQHYCLHAQVQCLAAATLICCCFDHQRLEVTVRFLSTFSTFAS